MRVALLGFGLIGGSLARALATRERAGWEVVAWSPTGAGPAAAAAAGTIATAAPDARAALDGAELVVLAAPPLACLELVDALAGSWSRALAPEAIVTDVASTKRRIVGHAATRGLRFVGGHPMAGRERTGYDASDPTLFVDRPWVVCGDDDADVARVERLAVATGARPVRMDPARHDSAVAAVSHLPLVLAAALVEAVAGGTEARTDWSEVRRLAASGWRDMTRLARGDVEMGVGIAVTNADLLAGRLRDVRAILDGWITDLEGEESADDATADAVRRRLADARARLESEAGR